MKSKIYFSVTFCIFLLTASAAVGYQINLTPRITVTEEYNDNLFLAPENEEVDDFNTIVTPGFTLEVLQRSSGLEISYDPGYSFYATNSEYNSWRHNALLRAWTGITRNTTLEFENAFLYTEDPVSQDIRILPTEEPIIRADTTIRRSRQPYYTNASVLTLTHQFGESDSFFIGYNYSILRNDDPEIEDNDRHIPSIGLTYWFTPRWGLETEASLTSGEFDISDDFDEWYGRARLIKRFSQHFEMFTQYEHTFVDYREAQEEGRTNYQIFEPSIGMNYDVAEDTSLSLRAGLFIVDQDEGEDDSGPSVDADITKTFRNGSIVLSGSAGHEISSFGAEDLDFTKYYEIGSTVEYSFTRNMSCNVFGTYRNSKYTETDPQREDDLITAGTGLTYLLRTWLSMEVGYSYRTIDSTIPENEYEENRVFFSVTLTPSLPYRITR